MDNNNNSGESRIENFFTSIELTSLGFCVAILYGGIAGGAVLLILIVIAVIFCVIRHRIHGGGDGGGDGVGANERNDAGNYLATRLKF